MAGKKKITRQLVHHSKVVTITRATVYTNLRGKLHRHFCSNRDCRQFYEDACEQPEINGLCGECRGTTRNNAASMDPVACCLDNTVQVVENDHLIRYALAGPGPWYQCRTCARTHGRPCTSRGTR